MMTYNYFQSTTILLQRKPNCLKKKSTLFPDVTEHLQFKIHFQEMEGNNKISSSHSKN